MASAVQLPHLLRCHIASARQHLPQLLVGAGDFFLLGIGQDGQMQQQRFLDFSGIKKIAGARVR